jgi:thiol-disulfide isomerase/thioredoxin
MRFPWAIAAAVLLAACTSSPGPAESPAAPEAGKAVAPPGEELVLESFDGQTVRLSDFRGKAVLVNSWAAWCPFCVAEIPDLERAGRALGDRTVVLFVQRTATESQEAGEKFLKQREAESGLTIARSRVLLDPQDSFYKTYFGFGMPVSLFVDPSGKLSEKKVGVMDEPEAREKLKKALAA